MEETCPVTSDEARSIVDELGSMKAEIADVKAQVGDMQARMEVLSSGEATEAAVERVMNRRQKDNDAHRYNELKDFARLLVVRGAVALFGLVIGSAAVYRFIVERVIS